MKGYSNVNITLQILYPAVFFRASLSSSLLERNLGECFIMELITKLFQVAYNCSETLAVGRNFFEGA